MANVNKSPRVCENIAPRRFFRGAIFPSDTGQNLNLLGDACAMQSAAMADEFSPHLEETIKQ